MTAGFEHKPIGATLVALVIVFGAAFGAGRLPHAAAEPDPASQQATRVLPTEAWTIGGETFVLEVPQTDEDFKHGLMEREYLDAHKGMIFKFAWPMPVSMWMKDCKIALDMLFVRNGSIITIHENAPPCAPNGGRVRCKTYAPKSPVNIVIELPAGTSKRLNLSVGDTVKAVSP